MLIVLVYVTGNIGRFGEIGTELKRTLLVNANEQLSWISAWSQTGTFGIATGHMAVVAATLLLFLLFAYFTYRFARIGVQLRTANRYRFTAEASGGVSFEFDMASRVIHWVDLDRLQFLGFDSPDDLQIGTSYNRVHPDDRASLEQSWDNFETGRKADLQIRLRTPTKNWVWFSLSAIPIKGYRGRYTKAIGVLRSTEALNEIQSRIAENRRVETVGTIAGGIAHEFNNHLTPVRGFIELALDDLPSDHPSYDGLQTALDRVIHCSELVSQIQAYGRKSLLVMRSVNLADLLDEAVQSAMKIHYGLAKNVSLKQAWPKTLPKTQVDERQFTQAIAHLIRNSFEAMRKGGRLTVTASEKWVDENTSLKKRHAEPGHFVAVSVRDTGSGIAHQHLDRVMDPFYTTHGRARAQGMGLSMVYGMMAQLGGWMDIVTSPNRGTEIVLYFPVDDPCAPMDIVDSPSDPMTNMVELPVKEVGRILAADDEVFIRGLVRTMFEGKGWIVDEAEDHDDVVATFGGEGPNYDLVLLDLAMPGVSAEESISAILTASPNTKILIASGKRQDDEVDRMMLHPGVDFIPKPYSPKELMAKVDVMMPPGSQARAS